jgi:histidine transport system permease protein/arginine/ornithine transport system permease protein
MDTSVITGNLGEYLAGAWLSLHLVGLSCLIGLTLAIPLAVLRVGRNRWLAGPVGVYTYFFRGTPMLVQLLLIYYGLAQFQWLQEQWQAGNPFWLLFREPYFCALLAFALNTCAYTTEIIAGSIRNVPNGEIEAAQAVGMSHFTLLRRIVLPSALRRAIPAYSNEVILMLQGSAIASAVTLVDITGAARNVYSRHFAPFEAFIFAGLIYVVLTFALVGAFRLAENRWLAHLRPRQTQSAQET